MPECQICTREASRWNDYSIDDRYYHKICWKEKEKVAQKEKEREEINIAAKKISEDHDLIKKINKNKNNLTMQEKIRVLGFKTEKYELAFYHTFIYIFSAWFFGNLIAGVIAFGVLAFYWITITRFEGGLSPDLKPNI